MVSRPQQKTINQLYFLKTVTALFLKTASALFFKRNYVYLFIFGELFYYPLYLERLERFSGTAPYRAGWRNYRVALHGMATRKLHTFKIWAVV